MKYTDKEIAKAVEELNGYAKRPEDMEYSLYREALREQKRKVKQHKLGMFSHVSAELIPKIGKDGRLVVPTQWIGKTKGTSYVNVEKQEERKLELLAHKMIEDEVKNTSSIRRG